MILSDTKASLIWGSFRGLVDFSSIKIPSHIRLVGTMMGEFPVDSFHPLFLEFPREQKKLDISSRHGTHSSSTKNVSGFAEWSHQRIVPLPIYNYNKEISPEEVHTFFSSLIIEWNRSMIPSSIPSAVFALKASGLYIEEREAQDIIVLVFWSNGTARYFTLEWFEGPLEDCISPEWYLQASELISYSEAFRRARIHFKQIPNWHNSLYSIFIEPSVLGIVLNGERTESPYSGWEHEWNYHEHISFIHDIDCIIEEFEELFSNSIKRQISQSDNLEG